MKYYANYMEDMVIKDDDNGQSYIKTIEDLQERPISAKGRQSIQHESFGISIVLEPISKEEYDTFGKKWYWSWRTGKKVTLGD